MTRLSRNGVRTGSSSVVIRVRLASGVLLVRPRVRNRTTEKTTAAVFMIVALTRMGPVAVPNAPLVLLPLLSTVPVPS